MDFLIELVQQIEARSGISASAPEKKERKRKKQPNGKNEEDGFWFTNAL